MPLDGQSIAALSLVAAAALYLVIRLFRRRAAGCTGCDQNACPSAAPPLVQLTHDRPSDDDARK